MATNWTICWTSHRNVGVNVGVGFLQARKLFSFNEKVWEFESLRLRHLPKETGIEIAPSSQIYQKIAQFQWFSEIFE